MRLSRAAAQHYLGRCLDYVIPLAPARRRMALRYQQLRLRGGEEELATIGRLVPRWGGTALDVGANTGLWTYALHGTGAFRRIVALEPNSSITHDLRDAALGGVEVLHLAASDVAKVARLRVPSIAGQELDGWATLEEDLPPGAVAAKTLEVECRRLDDLDVRDVTFVKIDVEGHELSVLRGAASLLTRDGPRCVVEVKPDAVEAVRSYLGALERPYEQVDAGRHGVRLSGDNVLFCPRERG